MPEIGRWASSRLSGRLSSGPPGRLGRYGQALSANDIIDCDRCLTVYLLDGIIDERSSAEHQIIESR